MCKYSAKQIWVSRYLHFRHNLLIQQNLPQEVVGKWLKLNFAKSCFIFVFIDMRLIYIWLSFLVVYNPREKFAEYLFNDLCMLCLSGKLLELF